MKSKILLAVLVIVAAAVYASIFIVNEGEQAIVTQFGKPVGEPIKNRRTQLQDTHYPEGPVL